MTFHFDQRSLNSAPILTKHPAIRLGLCRNPEAEKALIGYGFPAINVWMIGRGSETVAEVVERFRGEPGIISIAEDLRLLGNTQAAIFAEVSRIARAGITFEDINNPGDDIHAMQHRAFKALHSSCAIRNHRTARCRGSKGGLAKAANAAARRQAEVSDEVARKVWQSRLTKKEKCAILGCTISTGDRHYGVHAT